MAMDKYHAVSILKRYMVHEHYPEIKKKIIIFCLFLDVF